MKAAIKDWATMNGSVEEARLRAQKPTTMTFRQALLVVVYYAISQLIFVAIGGPVLRHFVGLDLTWKDLLLPFAFLASCGPVFVALVCWSRAARDRPKSFAIRFGLSMCAIVTLYASVVTLSARRLGLSFISPAALPGYFVTAAVFGVPVFSLTAYLLWRLRVDTNRRQSSS